MRAEHTRGRSHPSVLSKGGGSCTEGVSYRRVREPAVMASQIERLPDLAGYLKLALQPHWMSTNIARPAREQSTADT